MFTRDPAGGLSQIVDWSRSKGRLCWRVHEHLPDDLYHWYSIDTKHVHQFHESFPPKHSATAATADFKTLLVSTKRYWHCMPQLLPKQNFLWDPVLHTCLDGFECCPTTSKYMFNHTSFCNACDLYPMFLPQRRMQANILPIYWLFFSWSFDSCLQALEKLLVARRFSHILSASPSQSFGVLGLESNPSMSSKSSPGSWNIGFAGWGVGMSLHTGIILGFVLLRLQEAAANIFHLSI